jgi:hypothetical protein
VSAPRHMEKIVKRIAPLLALVVLLTGCKIRMDSNLVINADESGTYAIEMSVDSELRQLAEDQGEPLDLTQGLEDAPEGWTVEEFTNGDFSGVRIGHDFASIAEFEQDLAALVNLGGGSSAGMLTGIGLTHEGDEFTFESDLTGVTDALGGLAGADLGSELEGVDMGAMFEQLFEVRIIITMPGEIGENNADEVNGNTLTWNVSLADEGKMLSAVSSVGGGSASALLIAGVVLLALLLLGLGTFYLQGRRRRKEKEAVDAMGGSETAEASEAADAAEAGEPVSDVSEEPPAVEEEPPTP